ncbi:hypothetical protein E3N88_40314 [Mikania micrantha]|uniref:Uncharacterized protein n=1 Tax=Mikania micrantha TaxID=192012 RepID=A0A5N6LMC9_9ASTR|nr:hypothetical protein E3N88_40314 [Mikania micrantha]
MKQIVRTAGGGGWRIPTEDDVEVAEILLDLPKLCVKLELIGGYSFNWGRKKKRSVLDSKSESSPSPKKQLESMTAGEADKSPSTPLCFFTGGSGSDGGANRKPPSSVKKTLKRKGTDDLMETYDRMQQEREILKKKIKAMETLHQELTSQNVELKARGQKINYSKNIKDYHKWNSSMKPIDQQHCHHQITMFAPAITPQQPQHCHQQLVVDPNNGKLVCSSNSSGGGRFGLFNQIDPRVKIHGETYDFVASSQLLDQSKYLVMDNDLRIRAAAAARKRRILRMKENKKSSLAMKVSRACR